MTESLMQKAVSRTAIKVCRSFKHSFATQLRTVQELPGHKDIKTTMIYIHARPPAAGA